MRDIKFRAWDKETKQMITTRGIVSVIVNKYLREDKHVKEEYILMQFTGLKDSKGVEIYEGDIIDWHGRVMEVQYGFGAFYVMCEGIRMELHVFNKTGIVIGNIHSNPELLNNK